MVSSGETAIFAPSPPLSASAGASDSELDKHGVPRSQHDKQKHDAPRRLQAHPRADSRTRSPPSSTPGSFLSVCSPNKQERPPTQLDEGAPTNRCVRDGRFDDDLDDAFSLIKASWQDLELLDVRCPEWVVLHISTTQHLDLCRRLEEHDSRLLDYFENVLRSDYDPDRGILVLRLMASAVHEYFQENIKQFILTRLKEIGTESDPNISHIASNIKSAGHTKIKLTSESPSEKAPARKSPDCQFLYFVPSIRSTRTRTRGRYCSTRYSPQLIIEVGYSQKAKALRRLAQEYYEKSDARTVLTFNLGYSNPTERRAAQGSSTNQTASFSFYRGPDCIHRDTVFRDADGNPTADGLGLQLCLADLVPDEVLSQLSPRTQDGARNAAIDVTAQLLCQLLAEAEEVQDLWDVTSTPEPGQEDDVAKPLKRVNWEPDSDSNDGEDGHDCNDDDGNDSGGDAVRASRSKRRRRDSTYSPRRDPSGTDASLPTRSTENATS